MEISIICTNLHVNMHMLTTQNIFKLKTASKMYV